MTIKELLSDETRWTKGAGARDKDGHLCSTNDEAAVCWCLAGAINRCYSASYYDVTAKLLGGIGGLSITTYNDATERTYEEVMVLVDKLGI